MFIFQHKIIFLLFFSVHVNFSLVCNSSTSRPQVTRFLVPEKNVYLKNCASWGWLKLKKSAQNPLICKAFGQNLRKIRAFTRFLVKIPSVFWPNSKLRFCKVSAPRDRVSRFLAVEKKTQVYIGKEWTYLDIICTYVLICLLFTILW